MTAVAKDAAAVLGPDYSTWLDQLESAPAAELVWPAGSELAGALDELGLEPVDRQAAAETVAGLQEEPFRWILSRLVGSLEATMGQEEGVEVDLPAMPASLGDVGRCLPIYAFLLGAPGARAYHRRLGVPPEVTRASLRDLGRHVRIYRRMFGTTGVDAPGWMLLHVRGLLFECGRLQYEPIRMGGGDGEAAGAEASEIAETVRGEGGPEVGEPLLSVHIPESGPLLPEAVDRSFELVRQHVIPHLPGPRRRFGVCFSWLLDEQLASYLPETSNIIRFQRRFHPVPNWSVDGDGDVLNFVFRRPSATVDALGELPQRTTLERAVVEHLRGGGHWRLRAGWLALE